MSAKHLDALELFGQRHPIFLADFSKPRAGAFVALLATRANLAEVAVQSVLAGLEVVRDVHVGVRLISAEDPDLFNPVRFEPFFEMLRVGEVVAGIGKHGVQSHSAGHGVVSVPQVATLRLNGEQDPGFVCANLANDLLTKNIVVFQPLIRLCPTFSVL